MKTFKSISMAVMSLVMVACSNDITSERPAENPQGKGIPFSATISMRGSATRSVMTENSDKTISAAWETDDEMALVYEVAGKKQVTKAKMTVAEDKSATITATMAEGVTAGTKVSLLYPYSAVCTDAEKTAYGAMKEDSLAGQDGTLETIAKNFDLCEGAGELTLSSAGTASLKDDVAMKSLIAIWKISLSDGTKALKTQQLLVYKNNDMENMLANVCQEEATDVFYIAVPAFKNAQIGMQAPIGEDTYYYARGGISLEAGKFYQSTVTLADMLHTPLTLEAVESGTINVTIPDGLAQKVYYKKNGGDKIEISGAISVNAGDIVQFFSTNASLSDGTDYVNIRPSEKTYVYGNIMSLIDDGTEGFANDKEIGGDYALSSLFFAADHIAFHNTKDLLLPATTLSKGCYTSMFTSCIGLTRLPENLLPATKLKDKCYANMFDGCTSLTATPVIKVDCNEAEACMYSMFYDCTNLTTVPEGSQISGKLGKEACEAMFYKCTSLTTTPVIDVDCNAAEACMYSMFYECTNLTTVASGSKISGQQAYISCQYMFYNCTSLTATPVIDVNCNDATSCMNNMFYGCITLTRLDLSSFNTAKVTKMGQMFMWCSNMVSIYVDDGWNTDAVTNDYCMFDECTSIRGDMGTTYDPAHVDKAYAHLDGGPTNPGYLSMKPEYTRGDVDNDGHVKISDVTALINYLLSGDASAVNLDAADCDLDGNIKISDVTALINYLLSGSWANKAMAPAMNNARPQVMLLDRPMKLKEIKGIRL